jgi:hypothetical protein
VQVALPAILADRVTALTASPFGGRHKALYVPLPVLVPLCLQIHVSKPTDPEFRGMNGGLGVFGVMTEFLMQLTPLTYTTLTTIEQKDTNMFADVQKLIKVGWNANTTYHYEA